MASSPDRHVTTSGSRAPVSTPAGAPGATTRRRPPAGSTIVTWGGVRAPGPHRDDAGRDPSRCRGASPSRPRSTVPSSVTTTSRANPSSFRHSAIASDAGDHANERCPGPHAGSAWSCGSTSNGRAPVAVGDAATTGRSTTRSRRRRTRAGARRARTGAGPPRRAAHRPRPAAALVAVDEHDPRRGPRHRREVPLVPRDPATVGRDRGVPREVGTRPALRPGPGVGPRLGDVEGVVPLAREQDPAVGPAAGAAAWPSRATTVVRHRRPAPPRGQPSAVTTATRARRRPSTTSRRGRRRPRRGSGRR